MTGKLKRLKGVPKKRRVGVRHSNAEYRRRYKLRHPDRVKKADADYYARKQAALKVAAATKVPPAATQEEVDVKPVSPEALAAAQERFAIRFRRDVQKRIKEEHDERMKKPPSVLKAEADALVKTLHACGRSVNFIADSLRVTVNHVRDVLGIVVEPKAPKKTAPIATLGKPVQLGLFPLEVLRHG